MIWDGIPAGDWEVIEQPPMQPNTLPNVLRVGFKTYDVLPWPVHEAHAANKYGECDHHNCVIRIAVEGRKTVDVAETLLHEILHACWYVSRLEERDDEERIVSALASVQAQVLRDNKLLRDYLNEVFGAKPES